MPPFAPADAACSGARDCARRGETPVQTDPLAWVVEQGDPDTDSDYNMHVLKYVAIDLIVKLALIFLSGGYPVGTQPGSDINKLVVQGTKKLIEHKKGA